MDRIPEVLWKQRFVVLGIFAVFIAVSIVAMKCVRPVFVTTSKFICLDNGGNRMGDISALASLAGLSGAPQSQLSPSDYFNDIVEDDEFLEKILAQKWEVENASVTLFQYWKSRPDTTQPNWEYAFKKAGVSKLRGGKFIKLEKRRGNSMFTLETKFPDPKLTYQVNNFIIDLLNEYLKYSLATKSQEKRIFIEKRLREISAELKENENSVAAFRERNKEVSAPRLILDQSRLQRDLRINEELFLQLKKEYEMAKIEESRDTPLLEVISKPTIPLSPDTGKKKAFIPAGALLGLVTGALAALFIGWRKGQLV